MKNIVFDVGNVLLKWDARIPYRTRSKSEAEITQLFKELDFDAWNLSLDAGKDWKQGTRELIAAHPMRETDIRIFADNWHETVPHDIENSVRTLAALVNNRVPTYAITNFSAQRWEEVQERFTYLKTHFIDAVVSGQEGVTKPDKRIYEILLERNNLRASDCIFIDDSAKNITGAQSLGFETIHFHEDTNLVFELSKFGIAV